MAPHSSVLAWRIPGTGEPGGLPSMGPGAVRPLFPCRRLACLASCELHFPAWVKFYIIQESENVSRSVVSDSATPWTVACQSPLSMEFSRQEYWSGQPLPSPGDLPDPGIKPGSPILQSDSLWSEPPGKPMSAIAKGN